MSIFPYAYRMIESFNITQDESQISVYAGMLITAFAFAEFSTGMIWGRISDRVGRKPVLLMGLVGTALSMICFGFARTLPGAIMARALGGLLNGNVGVLQTTVAELVTKKEHQPRAYSVMPVIWSIGSIIGPSIGGTLAMPCDNLGFRRGGIFDKYPFLLPNLFCVAILIFGITVGILFLEETHAEKKNDVDFGRELAKMLLSSGNRRQTPETNEMGIGTRGAGKPALDLALEEPTELLFDDNDPPPGYRSMESSPLLRSVSTAEMDAEMLREKDPRGVVKTFSRQVILIVVAYAFLA
jgi:MFS family permease